MQSDYLPELGEEFAAISSGVCGISPLMAKLILYTELDDGYGRYFRSIFSEEDRKSPYFVQDVGTPMPRRLNSVSQKCVEMARECIKARHLAVGEWRSTWETIAMSGNLSTKLNRYANGALGAEFISYLGRPTSFVDALVAKRTLLDTLACSGAEDKLFTNRDMGSFMYRTLLLDNDWQPGNVCSPEFQEFVTQKAVEFTSTHLGLFDVRAPFVGVTFGWQAKDKKEWHLYGDLLTTDLFRCSKKDLRHLFDMVSLDVAADMVQKLYDSTYLCVVAVDASKRSLPDKVDNAFIYNFPMGEIVSCKWVDTLPNLCGQYHPIGSVKFKKEGAYNA
ncbi:hypothetical protein [Flavonifractor plautii]|jgi:hypothetical protein|uniref:hypothetical protein n=1 Tax=Flavonifractor plautii TaxID=292800 RepID=UPI0019228A83|nr:hypothetical protein [Flavonifractor plautii]MDC0818489.1 hypothetical protein [Flavonifractor plautii]